ncbi:MAG: hypothetical protein DRI73_10855 [Bacteroidetes bacterium]|nr:MAG: hypothetical protein DRI73_10855 [Bacteroidota bacterium]
MKDLIIRSYKAIHERGLIDKGTTVYEFYDKMQEELNEIDDQLYNEPYDKDKIIEEVTDLMTVCIMTLHHHGFDPVKEFEKCVLKNEKRAKNGK